MISIPRQHLVVMGDTADARRATSTTAGQLPPTVWLVPSFKSRGSLRTPAGQTCAVDFRMPGLSSSEAALDNTLHLDRPFEPFHRDGARASCVAGEREMRYPEIPPCPRNVQVVGSIPTSGSSRCVLRSAGALVRTIPAADARLPRAPREYLRLLQLRGPRVRVASRQ